MTDKDIDEEIKRILADKSPVSAEARHLVAEFDSVIEEAKRRVAIIRKNRLKSLS